MGERSGRRDLPAADGRQHEMQRVRVDDESGAEQWHCGECGRQMLLSWPPTYKQTVLVPGDETAYHTGGRGGVRLGTLRASASEGSGEIRH